MNEAEFDIQLAATRVIELLEARQTNEALAALAQFRNGQPPAAQEALDRYVAAACGQALESLRSTPGSGLDHAAVARLSAAGAAPRFPDDLANLTEAQRYDVYASIVAIRGQDAAQTALSNQERVILGLRRETATPAGIDDPNTRASEWQAGTGVYDDRIVVLWKDEDGGRHVFESNRANTEPTAQYDAHARPGFGREGTPYATVEWRRGEGVDANGDGTSDLGRLADGTIEMLETTHPATRVRRPIVGPNEFSLRPTPEAIENGNDLVQRDTNGDGWFNAADVAGTQDLNRTFKIHPGSAGNTDSAGCQTVHPAEYDAFIRAVRGNPEQDRWQYVLVTTAPRQERQAPEVDGRNRDAAPPQPQRQPQRAGEAPAPGRARGDDGLGGRQHRPGPYDADAPDHPDHALLQQIRGHVAALDRSHGRGYDEQSERISYSLLGLAKGNGLSRVDHVVPSERNAFVEHPGEHIFIVQGRLDDPAHMRAHMRTDVAAQAQPSDARWAHDWQQPGRAPPEAAAVAVAQQQPSGPVPRA